MCAVERSGGIEGNAAMTMVVGLVLIPPILVKLASTGYRFARYYTRAPAYLTKGPPLTWLRLLAPVLVVTTIGIFVSGIALLAVGHESDPLLEVHKISFIVWAAVFGVHFLAHLPEMVRSARRGWTLPGAAARLALVAISVIVGAGLALSLRSPITAWHG